MWAIAAPISPEKIDGSISGASSVTIYNSGTLGAAGKSISAGTGNLTLVNGKSTDPTGTVLSDVVNKGSTGAMSITNYGTPMAGKIDQKSSGLLTLTGTAASGRQYTGDISVARALGITGSIGENSEQNAVKVAFTGEAAVIARVQSDGLSQGERRAAPVGVRDLHGHHGGKEHGGSESPF